MSGSSSGTRQWRALMRKNCINWKRKAGCSFFELFCPIMVMAFMVFLRKKVHSSEGSQSSLYFEKLPTFPALTYSHRSEDWNFISTL